MRGNLPLRVSVLPCLGSIPARAGEPPGDAGARGQPGVYPRACGGTLVRTTSRSGAHGLSPRVRGNQLCPAVPLSLNGSIPARAGEPVSTTTPTCLSWVYPRACGGTCPDCVTVQLTRGLSPRVRGNRVGAFFVKGYLGSIPARAGEPPPTVLPKPLAGVYPRACGGTPAMACSGQLAHGLSPRVRGNPVQGTSERSR